MTTERRARIESEFVSIPEGKFRMGGDTEADHQPIHEVEISAFRMTKRHVTNAQYASFCEATEHRLPEFWGQDRFHSAPDFPDHPVVGVS